MEEIWKDVTGYEGLYKISNLGNLKSLEKKWIANGGKRKKPETIMKQATDTSGYKQAWLSKNGNQKNCLIHRLVAIEFVENLTNSPIINHKNCNKTDNRAENLEWVTNKENINHAYKNNLIDVAKGSRHGMSILKEEDILEIRKLSSLYTKMQLAEMFGVGRRSINNIVNRKSWKHI